MNAPAKAKKIFIAALILAAAVAFVYCYTFVKILGNNGTVSDLTGQIQNLAKQKSDMISLEDRVKNTEAERKQIDGYFVPKDGVVAFLNRLQAMADENGLDMSVSSVSIGDSSLYPNTFELIQVSFSATGVWQDVYRFASLIELMPLKIFADNADLEMVPPAGSSQDAAGSGKKKSTAERPLWKAGFDLRVLKLK